MEDSSQRDTDARMLRLSYASYAYLKGHDQKAGLEAVCRSLDFFGVSAPIEWFAVSDDRHQFNFALMFVVVESKGGANDYSVVVRGTNPLSLDSWFREDLQLALWWGGREPRGPRSPRRPPRR